MTAELLPNMNRHSEASDDVPAVRFSDAFSRLYRYVLVTDSVGCIRAMSNALGELCRGSEAHVGLDARKLMPLVASPEQGAALRKELRERGCLASSRVDIAEPGSAPATFEFSVLPLSGRPEDAGLFVVIARPDDPPDPAGAPFASGTGFAAAVLAGMPDALLVVDERGYIRFANPALESLVGHAPADLVGQPVVLLCHSARDLDGVASALAMEGGHSAQAIRLRAPDGRAVEVAVTAAPLPPEAGLSHAIILTLRDTTASQRALAEIQRKNDDLEHCVNTLAHDLRSPLVALLGFSRLLRQDYGARLDDTGLHFVDRIEQAGRTMETLIHDLLELSRIGQPGERRALVDPRSVLQHLHAELKPRLDAAGIDLVLPASPPLVYCDRTRLYQVFSNLIGNAIEHMGPCAKPSIVVDVVEEADCEHITVLDSGRGIAPEDHARIFEVFQSLGPRRDDRSGTGIGLAIVKKIAQTHGGQAWVESRLGHGSTFHVTFPRR
jgi:two-component system sensor kinase FixL